MPNERAWPTNVYDAKGSLSAKNDGSTNSRGPTGHKGLRLSAYDPEDTTSSPSSVPASVPPSVPSSMPPNAPPSEPRSEPPSDAISAQASADAPTLPSSNTLGAFVHQLPLLPAFQTATVTLHGTANAQPMPDPVTERRLKALEMSVISLEADARKSKHSRRSGGHSKKRKTSRGA